MVLGIQLLFWIACSGFRACCPSALLGLPSGCLHPHSEVEGLFTENALADLCCSHCFAHLHQKQDNIWKKTKNKKQAFNSHIYVKLLMICNARTLWHGKKLGSRAGSSGKQHNVGPVTILCLWSLRFVAAGSAFLWAYCSGEVAAAFLGCNSASTIQGRFCPSCYLK